MWYTEVTKESNASKEAIWQLWKDAESWNQWDLSIQYAKVYGKFVEGVEGILKPIGGPKMKFKIMKAIERNSFTTRSKLPLCSIDFIHKIDKTDNGIAITHRIEINGLLSSFFSKVMGHNMAKELPQAVENLIRIAENEK